jgi:SAM-dependent methyltransferase
LLAIPDDILRSFECSLCGAKACKILLTITQPDRFESALGISEKNYIRHWVECLGCGVALNINSPENVKLLQSLSTSYYEVDFKSGSIADKYSKIMALPLEKSDNAQRVFRIRDFTKRWFNIDTKEMETPHTVLDIGAGTGVFLSRFIEEFAKEGVTWKGVALEPDRLAFEHLRSLGKFDVKEMAFTGQPEFSNYDLCVLNKIVEHIDTPLSFMKNVRNVLSKDKGILYIEVPDIMTILYRCSSDNILGSLHYHLYGCRSLAFLLKESDFVLLHMSRIIEPSGKLSIEAFATLPSVLNVLVDSGRVW